MLIQQFKDATQPRSNADEPGRRQPSSQSAGAQPQKVASTETTKKVQNITVATLANEISSYLFKYLAGFRIPTHFMDKVSSSEMLVKQLSMIPLEVHVHNVATGEFCRRFGMKDGADLTVPIIEHYYKNPEIGNPLTNEFHIYSLGLATPEQLRTINRLASKTNVVLKSFFERRELKLLTMRLEFGSSGNQIMIGDEISPRTCRFADMQKKDRGSKDIFAESNDNGLDAYTEVRNRIYRTF